MNKYSFKIVWSDEDEAYIVTCREFPGLSAFGDTQESALAEAQTALTLMIEAYKESGIDLPPPNVEEEFSGQFRVRLPKSLHRQAAEIASEEGVSLNQFVLNAVALKVGAVSALREVSGQSIRNQKPARTKITSGRETAKPRVHSRQIKDLLPKSVNPPTLVAAGVQPVVTRDRSSKKVKQ